MTEKKYRSASPITGIPKTSFVLFYPSTERLIEEDENGVPFFSDEEVGQAYRAIAKYEMYGEKPDIEERALRYAVNQICGELDRNLESWFDRCKKESKKRNKKDNGSGESDPDPPPVVTSGHRSSPVVTIDTDNEYDNEYEYENEQDNDNEQDKENERIGKRNNGSPKGEHHNGAGGPARATHRIFPALIESHINGGDYFEDKEDASKAGCILAYFFKEYKRLTGHGHPYIDASAFKKEVLDELYILYDEYDREVLEIGFDNFVEVYQRMIDLYFESIDPGCWNIFHFFSGKIRINKYYDYEHKYGDLDG